MWNWLKKTAQPVRNLPKTSKKHSGVGNLMAYNLIGQPIWTPKRYDSLSYEGYQRNVIVYRCVNLISRGTASVPLVLFRGNEKLESHPLIDLLNSPSPRQAGSAFMEAVVSYLMLSGNCYIEAVFGDNFLPQELHTLRPDRVKIIPDKYGVPKAYEYTVQNQQKILPIDPVGERSSVLHLKKFHPLNDWYGMSPIEAASCAIDQHNAVSGHNLSLDLLRKQ